MVIGTRQLMLVAAIAEEGTITGASRRLLLTQSALSHQLKKLERRLGVRVFRRSGKRMVTTGAGERILQTARSVVAEINALEEDVRRIARGRAGKLRITTQCFTCYHWVPGIFPQFQAMHPGIELQIIPESSDTFVDDLLGGKIDLALAYEFQGSDALVAEPLFCDDMVCLVAPSHPYATRRFVEARDFADQHLLTHRDRPQESHFYRAVLMPNGVSPRQVSEVRLTEAVIALVAAGAGVAVMTRWTAAPDIASGRVVAVPVGSAGIQRAWHAVMLAEMASVAYVADFVALLRTGPAALFELAGQRVRAAANIRVIA